ncbi:hypothetical protein JR316_0009938 [Psilocybe cubensis]|uniref:Uncharacterized protein n=1 Tax=Psilocybe cubensis TaxID=181762 RepID=A0ACB8GQK9_PSICU|nr:hypothetical protein JR316_0009938 [Psilocybe cubensis]KAH9477712.1 hypothetical protein JR316_0009938 [Psilocybe cubensis]
MKTAYIIFTLLQALASNALAPREPDTVTAERVYHTMITEAPYMVDMTTTVTWTVPNTQIQSSTSVPTASTTS